ncbi:magnesium/cobalt transporter CorC [Buchnera aphidicola (Thelaxes californica)]|uniref:Magnesium and cobalt efflux protein CorC n=1 Tax=Buchnera aphidicola (Thelaxes californica) TaxID=1315998 RepID=A0A4D6YLL6_9GAMM|nr:CNNM family magnesium/cobalt transport protein CorC [Buchnera aphidicola]QCI26864.1 magnesium/cobalt transporter CorC [Buchnera aphidicola (Thelaxes californica)]
MDVIRSKNIKNKKQKKNKKDKKNFFSVLIKQLFYNKKKNKKNLFDLIKDAQQNKYIDPEIKDMLEGIIDITKQCVKEIMVPRSQMITLEANYTLNQCLDIIIQSSHSRFPVMNADKNYVKGFLIAKDLLSFMRNNTENFFIEKMLRPAVIVPDSKNVDSMLKEFQLRRHHMAVVIDEFGAVSGLITIEDILELIVGKIDDEYDKKNELNIKPMNSNTFHISALTEIKEFNEKFHTSFGNQQIDTVGGLIMQAFGKLPKNNEIITIHNFQFKIMIVNSRRIVQLQLKVLHNHKK